MRRIASTPREALANASVMSLPAGDVKMAFGLEYRTEAASHHGTTVGSPNMRREVESVFSGCGPDLRQPGRQARPPKLDLSLAARYEQYSDFGGTSNPKIGLSWTPSQTVKVRGSYGESFRAPRLTDVYDTTLSRSGHVTLADPTSTMGRSLVLIQQGHNPDVREERAKTWTGRDRSFKHQ